MNLFFKCINKKCNRETKRKAVNVMEEVIQRWYKKVGELYNIQAAKITNWSHFESEYILGRKIVFMCTAKGDPRPHITWYKNGIELYAHSFFQVHEWFLSDTEVKSKMEIDPATQMDAGYYECQADNQYAIDFKAFRTDYSIEFD
ncbi:Immunoglobulin domain-containing protein oig-4 [Armadillidium nasatum]|uniref:Immunoglobulin domain-containing protein oig-4 n=1 Tax=Armadillidium nasatum TaxID=96803 RepID=A0A5N5TKW9_9CRUS|nr:Immunoglobulin domain-containing protein oig-4 [Armadillidium nasatum]